MGAEIADAVVAGLGWPAEELLDSEEQDEPLAGQYHRDTVASLHSPLVRPAGAPAWRAILALCSTRR